MWAAPSAAQVNSAAEVNPIGKCAEAVGSLDGYVVRTLKVEGARWAGPVTLAPLLLSSDGQTRPILVEREAFSAGDRMLNTLEAVRAAFKKQEEEGAFDLSDKPGEPDKSRGEFGESRGSFGVRRLASCVKVVAPAECSTSLAADAARLSGQGLDPSKCVDVSVKSFYLRVDLYKIGSNVLPIPRSDRPTFFPGVPKSLLAFNPTFGISHDRRYGVSQKAGVSINLLDPLEKEKSSDDAEESVKLRLDAGGSKSLNKPFYNATARLSLERRRTGKLLENVGVEGAFDALQEPLGDGKIFKDVARLGLNITLRPRLGLVNSVSLNANYRFSGNRFFSDDQLRSELTTENSFEARALLDGRVADGVSRLGIWLDSNSPKKVEDSYTRLVGIFGYDKEIPLALNQTIGVELILGGGRTWGRVPEYARFYGGNSLGNFLYEDADSDILRAFPTGPLLRSFGRNQAQSESATSPMRGATSFWHVNLTTSFPIPSLSRPVIPDVSLDDDDDDDDDTASAATPPAKKDVCGKIKSTKATLKNAVKNSMTSARNGLASYYRNVENLPAEEAGKRAEAEVREICPAIYYLADQANLYSVKPLFMLDAARLEREGDINSGTRVAVGGGLQFSLVVARFEMGYLRSVRRETGDPRGNFVMRLVFQNLF
jgi:hypothetical protein